LICQTENSSNAKGFYEELMQQMWFIGILVLPYHWSS